ncbi:IniB N-terminal domain-containing protein [Dactylosporangium sp. CA-092794]|uniref:IniB N-terminal domain-containing protein n=1 Tax=Dactylosporangium sp. CA-092794 TaxID=3239929 RepID=UPI003D8BD1DC
MATPTLHDFVLNLLTDPAARAAFEIDPEGVLTDAGLGDITEADVQEVIPLVMDYAPLNGLAGLAGADEPVLGGIDGDVTGAVRQLQGITQIAVVGHAHGSDVTLKTTVSATAAAGVSVDLGGLPLAPAGLPVLGDVTGGHGLDLSTLGDPASSLDAVQPVLGAVDPVLGATDPVLQTIDPVVSTVDPVLGSVDPVLHGVDPILGTVDPVLGGAYGTVDGTLSTVTGLAPVGHAVDTLGLGGLTGAGADAHTAVDPVTGAVGNPHGLLDPATGTVTHTVDSTVSGVSGSVLSPGHSTGVVDGLLGGGDSAAAGTDQDHGGLLGLLH